MRHNRINSLLLAGALLLGGSASASAQGFKTWTGKNMETVLKRKLAPYVVIKNKRIKIIAVAQGNTPKEIPEILQTKLITDVQKDTGFIEDQKNPETILRFTVTAFDVEFRSGHRQSGNATIPFTAVNGNIEVSYQAIEVKNNAPVDSENLVDLFKQDYPPSSGGAKGLGGLIPMPNPFSNRDSNFTPSQSEVRNLLVNSIVKQMAQRAAPVEERFTVPLPLGKLEQLSRIAQTQSWGKLMEGAQRMTRLEKEKDDSYRSYLIGVANEGLAYEQTTNDAVRGYLFEARKFYDEARTKNPGEQFYIEPWTRVDKAVSQYDKIKRQAEEYRQHVASKGGRAQPAPTAAPPTTTPQPSEPRRAAGNASASNNVNTGGNNEVWDNQKVLQLWKLGTVTEAEMLEFVRNAPTHKFDATSFDAVMALKGAGVPASVIAAMREKATPSKAPRTPGQGGGRRPAPRPKKP